MRRKIALMLAVLGALVLLPVIAVFSRDKGGEAKPPVERKTQWTAGLLCGVIFFAACGLQQCGLVYTTAGKAGFITALYIVLVPIAGIFFHRKVGWNRSEEHTSELQSPS